MYALNLSQDIEENLAFLGKETGRDKDDLMNEAISRGIQEIMEDMEDMAYVKRVLQSSSRQWTIEEVETRVDLEAH